VSILGKFLIKKALNKATEEEAHKHKKKKKKKKTKTF